MSAAQSPAARSRVTAAVLAAGLSRRMGRPKLLLPWGDNTVLGRTLDNVLATAIDDVLVVTGAEAAAIDAIAAARNVPTVHNRDYAEGELLSSLRVAVAALPPATAVLVLLGDLPMIGPAIIDAVLRAYRAAPARLTAPVHDGQPGHPVVIPPTFFPALLALPPKANPRDLFRAYPDDVQRVPVDSDVIRRDLDTPGAYRRWRPAV